MKKTNLVLGVAAVLFAAGSAVASNLLVFPHYLQLQYNGSETYVCERRDICIDGSVNECVVLINGTIPASVYHQRVNQTTCSQVIFTNQAVPLSINIPGVTGAKLED
jgi:hypothetical protein